jgi:hypothetical protein
MTIPISKLVVAMILLASAATFDGEYAAGQDSYNLGHYDDAVAHFTKARALDPSKPGPVRWLGRTERAMKKWDACLADALAALRMAPGSPLCAEVRKDVEACRAGLGRPAFSGTLREGQGALEVLSDTEGAMVLVDGIRKGATPIDPLPLNTGVHTVRLTRDGYAPGETTVEVVEGVVIDATIQIAHTH